MSTQINKNYQYHYEYSFQLQRFKKSFFMKEMFIIHIIKLKDFADQPNSAEVTKSIYRI